MQKRTFSRLLLTLLFVAVCGQRGLPFRGKHYPVPVANGDAAVSILHHASVRSLLRDANGIFWFGSDGGGAFRYNGKTVTNVTREYGLENPDFPKTGKGKPGTLARVWSIAEDTAGNLWFGTIDAGAWRYDGKSLTNVTVKDGLNGNAVLSILRDKSGILWFGFDGGGVCSYDGKSFINITKDTVER